MITRQRLARLLIALAVGVTCLAQEKTKTFSREGFAHPVLRVPKMTAVPAIDGKLAEKEWNGAAAFTGLTAIAKVGHGSLVPQLQQAVFYLGYDDRYLYLAMRSPHPKGAWPVANVKIPDHDKISFDDHIEFNITPHSRLDATRAGKGFFRVVVNPKAVVADHHYYNGTPDTESFWSLGGPVACEVTDELWTLELAVDIARLGLEGLDGRELIVQLVRTDGPWGMCYAGWVGASWQAFKHFPAVTCDPAAPVFQLLRTGEVGAGEIDTEITLTGRAPEPTEVTAQVCVTSPDGATLYEETKPVRLTNGQTETVTFARSGVPIVPVPLEDYARRNHFEVKATYAVNGETRVLYHNVSPFMQVDDVFREKYIQPWISERRSKSDWTCSLIRMPYHGKAEARVDVDFFGLPQAVTGAAAFRLTVRQAGTEKPLVAAEGPIVNRVAPTVLFDFPKLADGEYESVFQLLDAGGVAVAEKVKPLTVKQYAWERNRLGISDEVIPPFLPLRAGAANQVLVNPPRLAPQATSVPQRNLKSSEHTLGVWGRNYEFAGSGLPKQLYVCAPTGTTGGVEPLLARPLAWRAGSAGTALTAVTGEAPQIRLAPRADQAEITGTATLGTCELRSRSFLDYDGWCEIEVTVVPQKPVELDFLDLEIELRQHLPELPVDTLYVQRAGDMRDGNCFGGIRTEPGLAFASTSLPAFKQDPHADWKSFVPRTYLGNGDRGLWLFAWSAAGWQLQDDQAMLTVERLAGGNVLARIRLLAGPLRLAEPRTLTLALQAAPVKPNHDRYRTALRENVFAHNTSGYRYYGDAVDSFSLDRDEDYGALRQYLLYGPRYQEHGKEWGKLAGFLREIQQGAKVVMYGTLRMTGVANEAFGVYGNEWIRDSVLRFSRQQKDSWNMQGTVQFTRDEQLSVYEMNWVPSFIDFFVWYHRPLLEKSGVNGTWWDNQSTFHVWDFNPRLGRMESTWDVRARRELTKRLNVMGWSVMRPPMWAMNGDVQMPWCQIFWMVENDWYADAKNLTALDQWTLDQFRAMVRTKSTTLITKPWLNSFGSDDPALNRLIRRSLAGLLWSHDVHVDYAPARDEAYSELARLQLRFDALVDAGDAYRCLFAGYWKTAAMVQPATTEVKASVYRNELLGRAAVVLLNTGAAAASLQGLTLDVNELLPAARGAAARGFRLYDLETGRDLAVTESKERLSVTADAKIAKHDFVILALETAGE